MITGSALRTHSVRASYDAALRMVRTALARQGLRVAAEVDVKARIRQELGAGVAPCVVLYVDDPAALLEAVIFDRGATLMIPQPLAVAGDHQLTRFIMRSPELIAVDTPQSVRDPLRDLLRRMAWALKSIVDRVPGDDALSGEGAACQPAVSHFR